MSRVAKISEITFIKKQKFREDYYGFYFSTEEKFGFTPGQYIQLHLPHAHPDDLGTSRYFSISSSPHEKYLLLTTKIPPAPNRISSFKKTLLSLETGSKVQAVGPMGKFSLEED